MQTLLRYPGGKTRAVKQLMEYIPEGIQTVVSPFFGGGSLELALAYKGVTIKGFDIFQPLVDFWTEALSNPQELATEVRKYHPLTKEDFYLLQEKQNVLPSRKERAAAFYTINRASFSGATLSGGMSPGHPRFNEASIQRLHDFNVTGVSVDHSDFTDSVLTHNDFLYCDPPYYINQALYGNRGDAQRGFNHKALAELLTQRKGWVLSYNDCPEVLRLYEGYRVIRPSWSYGMGKSKASNEILIIAD